MSKLFASRIFWGILLILGGILFLLDTLNVFEGWDAFWTILSGFVGIIILSAFFADRRRWWMLIPGTILIAFAVSGLLSLVSKEWGENLGGVIFLSGIGLSFWLVYLVERLNWWAIIPGGVMTTIAVVDALDKYSRIEDTSSIFFLGLALTFALVALLPNPVGRMQWAWIPAVALLIMGAVIAFNISSSLNYIWAGVLIVAGIFVVFRALKR